MLHRCSKYIDYCIAELYHSVLDDIHKSGKGMEQEEKLLLHLQDKTTKNKSQSRYKGTMVMILRSPKLT
jgi:hypothetical protein